MAHVVFNPRTFTSNLVHNLEYFFIGRYAGIIDRERLIAGVDCGFGTAVRSDPMVADSIVWAKLRALSEGAAIASKRLWGS